MSVAAASAPAPAAAPVPAAGATPAAADQPDPPFTLPAPDAAIAKEVAAYPFPAMTDPGYGPPAPEGLVLSRALINGVTELVLTFTRAGGPGPPPDQAIKNVMGNVAKQRHEDPLVFCIPPALDEALLAGTADVAALRKTLDETLASMRSDGVELPSIVMTQMEAYSKNQVSPVRIVLMTDLMQAKLRKIKAGPAAEPAKGTSAAPPDLAFLDQKKAVPAKLEWNREITLRKSAPIRFRVTSTARFSVLIVTDKGYQAVQKNRPDQMTKQDMFYDADPRTEPLEETIMMPAGSSWIMIKNESKAESEVHLECFPG